MPYVPGRTNRRGDLVAGWEFGDRQQFVYYQYQSREGSGGPHENHRGHYFTEGAVWDTLYPDKPTGTVRLVNSEVTVEALHSGLPGYLRIRSDNIILDHTILNSRANDVSNVRTLAGDLIDVVGAGERGPGELGWQKRPGQHSPRREKAWISPAAGSSHPPGAAVSAARIQIASR